MKRCGVDELIQPLPIKGLEGVCHHFIKKMIIMNCDTAKQINMVDFLIKLGYQAQKTTNTDVWFCSPLREEKTASFKVNKLKNVWYDFGEGCGGSIIDFVMKLKQCNTKEALSYLTTSSFSFDQHKTIETNKEEYLVLKTQEIKNEFLISYLNSRKINIEIARQYCKEVYYKFSKPNTYYGIGFKNDSGGYEIRNKFFKGCLGKKDVTTVINNSETVCVFESWSDFISYLCLHEIGINESYIILNSTILVTKAISKLKEYSTIKVFFDNDNAGTKAFEKIKNTVLIKVVDMRTLYQNYKDLNEYLMKR